MKPLALLWRVPLGIGIFFVFGVLAIFAAVAESRKKKTLGAAYEGPLDGDWEN